MTISDEDQAALMWLISLGIPELPALRILMPTATGRTLRVLDEFARRELQSITHPLRGGYLEILGMIREMTR